MELGCRTDKVGSAFPFPGVQVAAGFREERSALKYGDREEEFFFVSGWLVGTTGTADARVSLNTKGTGWCLDTGMVHNKLTR